MQWLRIRRCTSFDTNSTPRPCTLRLQPCCSRTAPIWYVITSFGDDGQSNNQLYMSVDEQRQALLNAGFKSVVQIHKIGSLVMHRGV